MSPSCLPWRHHALLWFQNLIPYCFLWCVELLWGSIKLGLSFLDTDIGQVVEILPRGRQRPVYHWHLKVTGVDELVMMIRNVIHIGFHISGIICHNMDGIVRGPEWRLNSFVTGNAWGPNQRWQAIRIHDSGPLFTKRYIKTSYCRISRSLEATRMDVVMIISYWNSTGISTALLPRCLSNFRAIETV